MKAYTDVPQSKILAEFLPIDTADCCYIMYCTSDNPELRYEGQPPMFLGDIPITEIDVEHIPCWSLAALLDVLPKVINNETLFIETSLALWHIGYRNVYTARTDNPIDACYEMITQLNKKDLL